MGDDALHSIRVKLKCLDRNEYEELNFGHLFPDENSDIQKLFKEYETEAADWYVKRWVFTGLRLTSFPEVVYDVIISVEGDKVKRQYNPMIRDRRRSDSGRYKVSDRYGVWLCKDFMPIVRVNDWISGFGSGSNATTLLHAFVNCQSLRLTANRGTVANTDPQILEELKRAIQDIISDVDRHIQKEGIYTLREWQDEHRTIHQERDEYDRRVRSIRSRKVQSSWAAPFRANK
ncbi:MAG: hypothetical protein IPF79_04940 [Ignavibacteria bacterium]|nr:hypothetical protein [Ignavibacteria bacterium]